MAEDPGFFLAVEHAVPGTRFHAVAEEGLPFISIAEAIGAGLGLPVRSITPEEAPAHFGWMTFFVANVDNPATSAVTRAVMGWSPREADLFTDMRESGYFSVA